MEDQRVVEQLAMKKRNTTIGKHMFCCCCLGGIRFLRGSVLPLIQKRKTLQFSLGAIKMVLNLACKSQKGLEGRAGQR